MNIKNGFKYILLIFVVSFSFVSNVFADDISFSISTDDTSREVTKGNEDTIKVNIKSSNNDIKYCKFTISSDNSEKVEYVSSNGSNNWNKDSENNGEIILKNDNTETNLSDGVNVLALKYKINDNGKVTIKSECSKEKDGEYKKAEDVVVEYTVNELADDTSLKSILINGSPLINFDKNQTNYAVPLDNPEFSIEVETNNPDYQDDVVVETEHGEELDPKSIDFNPTNDQGKLMIINITVNNVTEYEIAFSYEVPDLDGSLSSLKINGEVIRLVNGTVNYTYKLSDKATAMKVEATLMDPKNFIFDDGNSTFEYTYDKNTPSITIGIKPKSSVVGVGSTLYTVTIQRDEVVVQKPSSSSKPSSDVSSNPQTGNISMFVMAIVLISSLVGSVALYKKNIENYNG